MGHIVVTGSADGLGRMTAQLLVDNGHDVVVHARTPERAVEALDATPGATGAVVGDLSTIAGMTAAAEQVSALGVVDAIVHNAGVRNRGSRRTESMDGVSDVFAVNVLAPYVISALVPSPRRLVFVSSGLHRDGRAELDDLAWRRRGWTGVQEYSDSKLYLVLLAFAVARLRPDVRSNAVEPGWVPTRMGGADAPDDLDLAPVTQAWLAAGDDPCTHVSGQYFYHREPAVEHPDARDERLQDALLDVCGRISGITLHGPGS